MAVVQHSTFHYSQKRELDCWSHLRIIHRKLLRDSLWAQLYPCSNNNLTKNGCIINSGGVFGLKYSPDGEVLIAASEKNSFILMDPISEKVISVRNDAHTNCCNSVTFLDDRTFTTCSDDSSIAIWDLRKMKREVHRLQGHLGWVKNVEYQKQHNVLVSSGFDSQVLLWDLNDTDRDGIITSTQLLHVQRLCRMKLSPDGSSMYISSAILPYLIAIHNVDLMNMRTEVEDFVEGPTNRYYQLSVEWRSKDVVTSNHIELYHTSYDSYGMPVSSHSIDVHPRNSAILLHQIGLTETHTVIQNVKRHFSYDRYKKINESSYSYYFPRGCETHVTKTDDSHSMLYIKEVSFSSCGKLFAYPFRYGANVTAYDARLSEYESVMTSQLKSVPLKSADCDPQVFIPRSSSPHLVCSSFGHSSQVLCTAFSPRHIKLATGCQEGNIVFHSPVL